MCTSRTSRGSLKDSIITIEGLVRKIKELSMPAVAVTDHGSMASILEHYKTCKKEGIKPIIGMEAYMVPDRRVRDPKAQLWHLVLLASNQEGFKNLMRLSSFSNIDGFYYKPRVDRELLERHSKGLIALSACIQGEVPSAIIDGQSGIVQASWYKSVFPQFYLEIQKHGINNERLPDQSIANTGLISLSRELGIPLVATTDAHALEEKDSVKRALLKSIAYQQDPDEAQEKYADALWIMDREEIAKHFISYDEQEAVKNSVIIADSVEDYDLNLGKIFLPTWKAPNNKSEEDCFKERARKGLEKYFDKDPIPQEYKDRLEYELDVITKMKFPGYFMILADAVEWIDKQGIARGTARGSSGGSLVSMCLGITKIDPIKYGLFFERFLNPARVSPADIDLDFDARYKNQILDYFVKKFGAGKVAQIGTYTKFKAKSAMRDISRINGYSRDIENKILALIPDEKRGGQGDNAVTLDKVTSLEQVQKAISSDKDIKEAFSQAKFLEGLIRQSSAHACGIVLADDYIWEHVPLAKIGNTPLPVTQWDKNEVEKVGLIKFDFLSLKNVTIIQEVLRLIKDRFNLTLDIDKIPDVPEVYSLIEEGKTYGLFQLSESGMANFARRFKPKSIQDLSMILALYRPGPMDNDWHEEAIKIRSGGKEEQYPIPQIKPILQETHGLMVYQEQVLAVAREMAGYTLAQADLLRWAIGKKLPEEMQKQKESFIKGCIEKGYEKETAESMFDSIEKFSDYSFNRSHSIAYSLISYQTAYLKYHFPEEFYAGSMTLEDDSDKLKDWVIACKDQGICILAPDINLSEKGFKVEKDKTIRFGLNSIKGIDEASAETIIIERRVGGKYTSLEDLMKRLRVCNLKCIKLLIDSGSLDSLGLNRSQMRYTLGDFQPKKKTSQLSLFQEEKKLSVPNISTDRMQDILLEKAALGFYLADHPLDLYKEIAEVDCLEAILSGQVDDTARVLAVISGIRTLTTKKDGKKFASLLLEDKNTSVEAVVFPRTYESNQDRIKQDSIVYCSVKLAEREGRRTLIVQEITDVESYIRRVCKEIILDIKAEQLIEHAPFIGKYLTKRPSGIPIKTVVGKASVEIGRINNTELGEKIFNSCQIKFKRVI